MGASTALKDRRSAALTSPSQTFRRVQSAAPVAFAISRPPRYSPSMHENPTVIAALDSLPMIPEPFGQRGVNKLFRACIAAAGVDWETPQSLALILKLWNCDSVISAIGALQEAHEANRDTTAERGALVAKIEAEIRAPE